MPKKKQPLTEHEAVFVLSGMEATINRIFRDLNKKHPMMTKPFINICDDIIYIKKLLKGEKLQ